MARVAFHAHDRGAGKFAAALMPAKPPGVSRQRLVESAGDTSLLAEPTNHVRYGNKAGVCPTSGDLHQVNILVPIVGRIGRSCLNGRLQQLTELPADFFLAPAILKRGWRSPDR